ncbi:uncharacterized protein KZ484_004478 [Pholidichthys leucotaenia]
MKSTITDSEETLEAIYEDPDALLPVVIDEEQPNVTPKPLPTPRSKLQLKTTNADRNAEKAQRSQNSGYPKDYVRPHPVRLPPPPPTSQTLLPSHIGEQNPPVPPRSKRSPVYHDKSASARTGTHQIKPPPPPPKPSPPGSVYGGSDTDSGYTEIDCHSYLSVIPGESDKMHQRQRMLQFGPRQHYSTDSCSFRLLTHGDDITGLLSWFNAVSKFDFMAPSVFGLSFEEEIRSFNQRGINVAKALRLFNLLMMKHKDGLQNIITEFRSVGEQLDRIKKNNKTMAIAGGTTGAVGGVTAVAGIAFAPVTMGTSLIATAVGAGMIASAGGMGVHAAKVNKKMVNRTTVETLVNNYKEGVFDVERCLDCVLGGMKELQRHNVGQLARAGAHPEAVAMAYKSWDVLNGKLDTTSGMNSERLLQAFASELDLYFTAKNDQKLKKSDKSKFSGRVSMLAKNLQDELNHLKCMWEKFCLKKKGCVFTQDASS